MLIRALFHACTAALLGGLLTAPTALAANGEKTPLDLGGDAAGAAAEAGSSSAGLVRTIVGLAVVIGVIYGLTWVLRQIKASREATTEGSGLETMATLALGPNRSLHLVRTGDEVVLVGAAEHGVTPIRTYSLAEAKALGLMETAPASGDPFAAAGDGGPLRRGLDGLRRRTVRR
jgi:flagellar protein FliO/FliZ